MKKVFLFVVPLFFLFFNCEQDSPTAPPVGAIPELSQLSAPETLYLISEVDHFVSVHVDDPQGLGDIAKVTCSIFPPGNSTPVNVILLKDEGVLGDIVPKDGTFTNKITADSVSGETGNYSLVFKATDISGNESELLSHDISVIDGVENIPPTISNLDVPLMLDIQDTTDQLITLKVNDPQGLSDIEFVLLAIYPPTTNSPVIIDTLWDNGTNGDSLSGDGIYSQLINIKTFLFYQPGKYSFKFQATDKAGETSNSIIEIIKIIPIFNDPPVISNLIAPSTMQVLQDKTVSSVLEVTAADSQGLDDIWSVYFNSYKPDGLPSKSNPFKMYDDGNEFQHGDKVAEDGIYSLQIHLPPGTPPGTYRFEFEAEDFLEAKSNKITHLIEVIQ